MMNPNDSDCVRMYAQGAYAQMAATWTEAARPFMLLRPSMVPDGNKWSALYGDNIQQGVCGFGDTPEKAALDFDRNWHQQKLDPNEINWNFVS